jgi:DNA-binding winged helix-turn-helix (wHTH) protein/Tfp pilus assembly protein PilF
MKRSMIYEFGDFRVDSATLQVFHEGATLAIPPKAVEVLLVLLKKPGETVTRTTLLNTVWPDTVVEEANLSQYVYLLRKALSKGGRNIIVTVARRGYRLVEDVRLISGTQIAEAVARTIVVNPSSEPVLSILPFETLDEGSQAARLGLGIARGVAQRVVRLKGLTVRPVGSEAPSTLALRGSILAWQGRVRVSTELIDTLDGSLRWAETIDENSTDWFTLQDRVADRIALLLAPKLSKDYALQHSSARQNALNLYLKGRFYWHKRNGDDFQKAIQHYNKALALDPTFALAYAGLADCYNLYAYYCPISPRTVGNDAVRCARKAVELDPNLAEGCVSLARALIDNEWDWENAEALFQRAITLNPHYAMAYGWYSCLLVAKGRFTEGMVQMMRANELNPNSLTQNRDFGFFLYASGRAKEAAAHLEDVLEMDRSALITAVYLAAAYEEAGMYDRALQELNRMLAEHPHNMRLLCELGCVLARAGRQEEARAIAQKVRQNSTRQYVCPYDLTMLHAAIGDLDEAFQWLTTCLEVRPWRLVYGQVDPRLAVLRQDPRFTAIARRVRFGKVESREEVTTEEALPTGAF